MTKPFNPVQATEEADKLISLGDKNVDIVIQAINRNLATGIASNKKFDVKHPLRIFVSELQRPNENWEVQNIKTIKAALKKFQKEWLIIKKFEWSHSSCNVTFTKKQKNHINYEKIFLGRR